MIMEHTIKKLPESRVEILVSLSREDIDKYLAETEERLASQITIEGFRPGKVPKALARKRLGEQAIKEQALKYAIEMSFDEVLKKEKLEVLKRDEIKIKENTNEKLVYQLALSVLPVVTVSIILVLILNENWLKSARMK